MNRISRTTVALVVVSLIAVAAIAALRAGRTPVIVRQAPSAKSSDPSAAARDNAAMYERIQISMAAATTRNEQAIALCESDINRVLEREFAEIKRKGDQAVAEVATYSSCCGIIYRLAKDKVLGGARAADYVDTELGNRLRPALRTCARELDTSLARFDRSLAESTVTLASELAQVCVAVNGSPLEVSIDVRPSGDLEATLRNLGFDAAAISVGGMLDVWALLNSRLAQGLLTKATSTAATMFARPAAAAAAEMTVAVADGPLPIGDMIALIGGAWTAYDVYATRTAFEQELKTTLANALPEMKRSVHDQVMTRIRGTLDAHRRVQDSIRTASTNGINNH